MTKSELEELVLELQKRVDILEGNGYDEDTDIFEYGPEHMALIAHHLTHAFVWEDSPLKPKDFDDWDELVSWFESLGEE